MARTEHAVLNAKLAVGLRAAGGSGGLNEGLEGFEVSFACQRQY